MSLLIGITADDLTGAADTAAAFARAGAPVPISLNVFPPTRAGAAAFAVTTETRARAVDEVGAVVSESVRRLGEAGAALVYKKIDSNLRGHVGRELAAVQAVLGGPLLLAPAFPARGRTTRDGVVLIDGVPVAETEMGRDPEAPARHSDLAALLRSQCPDLRVRLCPLAVVRQGAAAVGELLRDDAVLVADAETDADLDLLAEAALSHPSLRAVSGCAGFAAALARRLYGEPRHNPARLRANAPVLAVLASASRRLPEQIAHVAGDGAAVIPLQCDGLTDEERPLPELEAAIVQAVRELAAGRDTVVYAAGALPKVARPVELVVEHLAHAAYVVARRARPEALLVGGGATAQGVLGVLGAEAIQVDDEPLPGIAAGVIAGGEMDGKRIALKPGAAGGVTAVAELLEYLGART